MPTLNWLTREADWQKGARRTGSSSLSGMGYGDLAAETS
jgi:hypothetical protein